MELWFTRLWLAKAEQKQRCTEKSAIKADFLLDSQVGNSKTFSPTVNARHVSKEPAALTAAAAPFSAAAATVRSNIELRKSETSQASTSVCRALVLVLECR